MEEFDVKNFLLSLNRVFVMEGERVTLVKQMGRPIYYRVYQATSLLGSLYFENVSGEVHVTFYPEDNIPASRVETIRESIRKALA